jgi:hypothetical protein
VTMRGSNAERVGRRGSEKGEQEGWQEDTEGCGMAGKGKDMETESVGVRVGTPGRRQEGKIERRRKRGRIWWWVTPKIRINFGSHPAKSETPWEKR